MQFKLKPEPAASGGNAVTRREGGFAILIRARDCPEDRAADTVRNCLKMSVKPAKGWTTIRVRGSPPAQHVRALASQ